MTRRLESLAQAGLFAVFLVLPLLDMGFGLDATPTPPSSPTTEELPEAPSDLALLATFPERFESYLGEHFGWRNWLIEHFHQLNYRLFRTSESHQVHVGKDGWLYYAGGSTGYQRANVAYTDRERRRWFGSFRKRHEWLEGRGIHYLLTVAPNKHSIYPEHLPLKLTRSGEETRWELISRLLAENTEVPIVDLHGPLLAAKEREQVYERTGSHWNARGAYIAYREIFAQLAEWFPQLEPIEWEDLEHAAYTTPADLVRLLSVSDSLSEERFRIEGGVRHTELRFKRNEGFVTEQDDPTLPRAVIFHDSFTVALAPLLAEHFSYAVFQWRARFDGHLIDRVRPDVVIEQRVERRLMLAPIPNVLPPTRPDAEQEPAAPESP